MSNFISLDEAAKQLGVSSDELVEMLSRGEIFGVRDGATSWKFKPTEIERVASERMGDALDEDPAGSSILVSESDLGLATSEGSTIGTEKNGESDKDSDVALVADPGSGSDVRLVASKSADQGTIKLDDDEPLEIASSDDDDEELGGNDLSLEGGDEDDLLLLSGSQTDVSVDSDVELGNDAAISSGSGIGSDIPLSDSDKFDLSGDASNVLGGGDSDLNLSGSGELIKGDSDPSIDSEYGLASASDLELTDDGDLVLGSGSDLAMGTDSGINLMSPADSGISLEDEPLDLAASGISGLDLAAGSDVDGSASGSAVDFQQDEEFQLSPSGAIEADDDSGSQVIELEDSSEFGDAAVAVPSADAGFDAFADVDSGLDAGGFGDVAPAGARVAVGTPEVPYSLPDVLLLLGILLLMSLSGILVTDVVRNMWAWAGEESSLTSGFTEMILGAFRLK